MLALAVNIRIKNVFADIILISAFCIIRYEDGMHWKESLSTEKCVTNRVDLFPLNSVGPLIIVALLCAPFFCSLQKCDPFSAAIETKPECFSLPA